MTGDNQQIPSVWVRPRRKKEQPNLSQERIVAEALALLDAEGLEALSMRALGTRLGAGATSIYRHVASKDELIELVADEVYAEIEVPEATADNWRLAATAMAHSFRAMGLRHRWVMMALGQVGLSYIGPNVLDVTDRSISIFRTAGFDPAEAVRVNSTIAAYVVGITSTEVSWLEGLKRAHLKEDNWAEALQGAIDKATETHPRLMEAFAASETDDMQMNRNAGFEYGLERILDGVQFRLTARLSEQLPASKPEMSES